MPAGAASSTRGTLASFKATGLRIVEFPFPEGTIANLEKAHAETVAAMQAGVDIIYQGTFFAAAGDAIRTS